MGKAKFILETEKGFIYSKAHNESLKSIHFEKSNKLLSIWIENIQDKGEHIFGELTKSECKKIVNILNSFINGQI